MSNREWSDRILRKADPEFKHRWVVYSDLLENSLRPETVWIDCGCGDNGMVARFGSRTGSAVGVDVADPAHKENFVKADIRTLPFPSEYADLITLRFVVEHFSGVDEYMSELARVAKKSGKIIILTTNLLSPLIFLPRALLPYSLKHGILTKLFRVGDDDVFPTYHRLNTLGRYRSLEKDFAVDEALYISDLNYTRKWVFMMLLLWHKLTGARALNRFRTNLLVVLRKR